MPFTPCGTAIGGENISSTVEGRRRFPVRVRYFRDYREDIGKLKRSADPQHRSLGRSKLCDVRALEEDSAPGWLELAAYQVEQSRLARSVGSYDGLDRKRLNLKTHIPHGYMTAEFDGKVSGLHNGWR